MSFLLPPLPPTFAAALRDVHARGAQARVAAAERLATPETGERDAALDGLLQLAADADARVRASAVRALRELGDERAIERLLERLDDGDALVRELALIALDAIDGVRARAAVRRALRSAHAELRFQAVASLAEAGDAADLDALAPLLRDPDPKVRANTARGLGRFGKSAAPALREALGDATESVRCEAALALARSGDAAGKDALHAALRDPALAIEALDAIGSLKLEDLREPVASLAQSVLKPLAFKVAAARALLRLGDARGVVALREVLRAFRSDGRSYAVEVVGELRVGELAGELVRLSKRSRGTDSEGLVDALVALLADQPQAAREGLERLAARDGAAGERAKRALAAAKAR